MPNMSKIDEDSLRTANIRPTRPRMTIARAIREGGDRHITPEGIHREICDSGKRMSLATVYNTLNQFSQAGLVRRVELGERSWYCTNTGHHHHFFHESTGRLEDIPGSQPVLSDLPAPPPGTEIVGVELIVRVRPLT